MCTLTHSHTYARTSNFTASSTWESPYLEPSELTPAEVFWCFLLCTHECWGRLLLLQELEGSTLEIPIPGEPRTTTGLRMKRRVVTTQEAAAEDDRSAGLQIGSVGVRGQMMNAHSKTSLRATWDVKCATPSRHLLLYRWHHFFFLAGNRDSQEGFYCNERCVLGVYRTIILSSALLSIQNAPLANGTALFHCWVNFIRIIVYVHTG